MSLLPETDLELLHTRRYEAKTYLVDESTILVRGAISDTKPPGMYVPDDAEPLEIHQMHLDFTVDMTTFEITDAGVEFKTNPMEDCPQIAQHYKKLVGLSIARGFGKKIRELFGGPNGCAHTTALLQAMAPAAIQTGWSLTVRAARRDGVSPSEEGPMAVEQHIARNLNTCHIWAEDGVQVQMMRKGDREPRPPLQVADRLVELGRDPNEWFAPASTTTK